MDKMAMMPVAVHEMALLRSERYITRLIIGWVVTVVAFFAVWKIKK